MPRGDCLIGLDALPDRATLADALAAVRTLFHGADIDDPALDARLLLCASAGLASADLIREPGAIIDAPALRLLRDYARRRVGLREPVSRILGRRGFWSLSLNISPAVLDPRPETEGVVEAVLEAVGDRRDRPCRILDLGSGSGAILCALLAELPNAFGLALDRSEPAARVARANLARGGFGARSCVLVGSWGDALAGPFDLIVSNPPYIRGDAIETLPAEVRDHDPRLALDGGADGLDAYRAIAKALPTMSAPGTFVALEIGAGQASDVIAILGDAGVVNLLARRDLSGHERIIHGALSIAGRQGPER